MSTDKTSEPQPSPTWVQPLFMIREEGEPDYYSHDFIKWDNYLLFGAIEAEGLQRSWESWQQHGIPTWIRSNT